LSPLAVRRNDVVVAQLIRGGLDVPPLIWTRVAVTGNHIHAKDGDIGHVQGFLVDDSSWSIRFLIADTSNWWGGHQVLLSPAWIQQINWATSTVTVDLTRQAIKDAPLYDGGAVLERNLEAGIYNHYGRRGYWHEPATRAA
jgi:hypothetical protein